MDRKDLTMIQLYFQVMNRMHYLISVNMCPVWITELCFSISQNNEDLNTATQHNHSEELCFVQNMETFSAEDLQNEHLDHCFKSIRQSGITRHKKRTYFH